MSHSRIFYIDIARTISMLWIVGVWHLFPYTGYYLASKNYCYSFTYISLGTFFFLSSYLISKKYHFSNWREALTFCKKRFIRFWPLFAVASILFLYGNTLQQTVLGLLGLSPFWGPQPGTLWFMATLMFFYIITPLLASENQMLSITTFLVVLCLGFLMQYFFHSLDTRIYFYFPVYYSGIIAGKLGFEIKTKYWYIILFLYLLFFVIVHYYGLGYAILISKIIGIYILLLLSKIISSISNNKLNNLVTKVGYASLCVYLFHRPFYHLGLIFVQFSSPLTILLYLWLIVLPITIICCYFVQKVYDSIVNKVTAK